MACLISFKGGANRGGELRVQDWQDSLRRGLLLTLYHMAQSSGRFNRHLERMLNIQKSVAQKIRVHRFDSDEPELTLE